MNGRMIARELMRLAKEIQGSDFVKPDPKAKYNLWVSSRKIFLESLLIS
jgi:hypothetical protein